MKFWGARIVIPVVLPLLSALCCRETGHVLPSQQGRIDSDADLFDLITRIEPFAAYSLFPRVDSLTSGTLNGSNAHQPLVRVSMNAAAFNSLVGDTLPAGSSFDDGSVIVKQIISGGQTILYAVMCKDRGNALANGGWIWAEMQPDGGVVFSVNNRGSSCTGCHGLEQGLRHDYVRTFERQR